MRPEKKKKKLEGLEQGVPTDPTKTFKKRRSS